MAKAVIRAGNAIKIKRKSNKLLYIILGLNTLTNVVILLKLYEVI